MLSIVKGPYLQNPTGHSMTVMWKRRPATSRVDVLHAERIHSGHQGNYKRQFTFRYFCRWVSNTDTPNQRGGPRARNHLLLQGLLPA